MNNPDILVAPSLLSADFAHLASEIAAVSAAGADLLHCDVMDGRFVPNITFGPPIVAAMKRAAALPLDVHLMIAEPERWVDAFIDAGADWLTIHVEGCVHLHRTLQAIRGRGVRAGVVLNPSTHPGAIEYVLEEVDHVLVMSVNPGFGGQAFIPATLRKLEFIAEAMVRLGLERRIEVDGGVTAANVASVVSAGATVIVAGSAVFGAGHEGVDAYRSRIQGLRSAVRESNDSLSAT